MSDGVRGVGPTSIHADVAPPAAAAPERMPTLGSKLTMHDVHLRFGTKTYSGAQIARLNELELDALARQVGLDPGSDVFELLWCLAVPANQGELIDLGESSDLLVALRANNGRAGDFLLHEALAPPTKASAESNWVATQAQLLPAALRVERFLLERVAALLLAPGGPRIVASRAPDPPRAARWLADWQKATQRQQEQVKALMARLPERTELVLQICAEDGYADLRDFLSTADEQHLSQAEQYALLDKVSKSADKSLATRVARRIMEPAYAPVRANYLAFLEHGTRSQIAFLHELSARDEALRQALAWIGQHPSIDVEAARGIAPLWPDPWSDARGWLETLQRLEGAGRLADAVGLIGRLVVNPEGASEVLDNPAKVLKDLADRRVTFHYRSRSRSYELTALGAHAPEKGVLSLERLLRASDPKAELRRFFPELDADLVLSLLYVLPLIAGARRLSVDISPGGALDRGVGDKSGRRLALFEVARPLSTELPPVPRAATLEQVHAASRNRIFISATGPTEMGYIDLALFTKNGVAGNGTVAMVAALKKTGRLGAALSHVARHATTKPGDDYWQLPTGVGDGRVVDRLPPSAVHALIVSSPESYRHNAVTEMDELREALGDEAQIRNVVPLIASSAELARDAAVELIDRTPVGEVAYVHILTHGGIDGVFFEDGSELTIPVFKALYERAEAQGVRLAVFNDACYAGSVGSAVGDVEAKRLAALEPHGPLGMALRVRDLLRAAIEATDRMTTELGHDGKPIRVTDATLAREWLRRLPQSTVRGAPRPANADPLAVLLGNLFDRPELEKLGSFVALRDNVAAILRRGKFFNAHEAMFNEYDEIRLLDLVNDLVADLVLLANQANDRKK